VNRFIVTSTERVIVHLYSAPMLIYHVNFKSDISMRHYHRKKAIIYNETIPCRDRCVQGQHDHCMLYNFPEQTIFLLYAEQQHDQVDCFSNVEALQQ